MFLDILEFRVEHKKNCLVWKCVLRFNQKIAYMSKKLLLEKSAKAKKKPWKHLQSLADSGDKTSSPGRFLRPHFQNSFPWTIFLFSTPNSKMSRNTRKLHHKVRNGQNLPHESLNFTIKFFQSNFTYNLGHFSTSLIPHYQNIFFFFFFFFGLNSKSV